MLTKRAFGKGNKTFWHGIIAMKARPFHRGHEYLINSALSICNEVTVLLVYKPDDDIPVEKRYEWIVETCGLRVRVISVVDIETDDTTSESNVEWALYTKDLFVEHNLLPADAVFSSEEYAVGWANALSFVWKQPVSHIMVDRSRTAVPISGTMIRQDPYSNWQFLPPATKAYYTIRVCVVGPESTGKTTLCGRLAEHYNTERTLEYGRLYVERRGNVEDTDHRILFPMILDQQPKMEDKIFREANRIAICDTDLITTGIWYEVWQPDRKGDALHQAILREAENRHYNLYLLSVPDDAPWVDDGGLRDQPHTRQWFTWEFRKRLAKHGDPVVELSGSWDTRFFKAVDCINRTVFETGTEWKPPGPSETVDGIGTFVP